METTEFDRALATIAFVVVEGNHPLETINGRRLGDVSLEMIVSHLNDGAHGQAFAIEEDHGSFDDTDTAWI